MADAGDTMLAGMITALENLPGELLDRAAPDVAKILESETRRTIAAGTDAYGKAWRETRDGELPLQGAAGEIRAGAIGRTAVITMRSVHVRHHRGWAQGGVQRAILPTDKIPPRAVVRITAALTQRFQAATQIGGR